MAQRVKRLLFWMPRILGMLYAAALGLAALSAFWGRLGFWRTVPIFLLELIPAALVAALLAVSWRWEWVGAIVFTALGALYLAGNWGVLPPWPIYVLAAGPLFLMGGLFLASRLYRHGQGKASGGRGDSAEQSPNTTP